MTALSIWTPSTDRTVSETLPPLPAAAQARLDEMMAGLKEESPGRYSISSRAAPSPDERLALTKRRRQLQDAMATGDKEAIADRIHGFAYGFGSLRSLDQLTFAATKRALTQAVDHLPYEAVSRACLAWTKGLVKWANCRYPPDAPELARAAEEKLGELRMEERAIRVLSEAKVVKVDAAPPTQAQRDKAAADAAALIEEIKQAGQRLDADLSAAARAESRAGHLDGVRRFQAAEAERKARIAAQKDAAGSEGAA